jgi:hypothetical protein
MALYTRMCPRLEVSNPFPFNQGFGSFDGKVDIDRRITILSLEALILPYSCEAE